MENKRKGYEIFDENISPDNVIRMAELIAIRSVKFMCQYKLLDRMYIKLLRDIDHKDVEGYVLSDSYDLVQTAAMFLCNHMGKSIYELCEDRKNHKMHTIIRVCLNIINHEIYEIWKRNRDTRSTELLIGNSEPYVEFERRNTSDFTKYDEIMSKLNLTNEELETLNCYMAGISFTQQAILSGVNLSTIWRRRNRIQKKYLAIMHTL